MIKLVKDGGTLKKYKIKDIYYVRIMSLAAAYGFGYDFLRFYVQRSGGRITAVISVLDSDVTVSFDSRAADTGEIAYFLGMTGFKSILCSGELHLDFPFDEGAVMKKSTLPLISCKKTAIAESVPLKQLYDFMDTDADFEYWYADINHRIRHGAAGVYAAVQGGEIISAALLSAVYRSDAILSAVKTDEKYRGQGLSSAVISYISETFGGGIYLMRETEKTKNFYEKLGFKDTGIWRIYK